MSPLFWDGTQDSVSTVWYPGGPVNMSLTGPPGYLMGQQTILRR
jgi:hypothetical protein